MSRDDCESYVFPKKKCNIFASACEGTASMLVGVYRRRFTWHARSGVHGGIPAVAVFAASIGSAIGAEPIANSNVITNRSDPGIQATAPGQTANRQAMKEIRRRRQP